MIAMSSDFGSVMAGLSALPVVTALLACGGIVVFLGFAAFLAKFVGRFFSDERSTPEYAAEWRAGMEQDIAERRAYNAANGVVSAGEENRGRVSGGASVSSGSRDGAPESWGISDVLLSGGSSSMSDSEPTSMEAGFSGGGGEFGGAGSEDSY